MAKLTGQTIAASYDQLLIVGDADGISSSLQAVESADTGGSSSALSISTVAISVTGNTTMTTADNTDTLTLISTDADAISGPNIRLYRNSASPAQNDVAGQIDFEGKNTAGSPEDVVYGQILSKIETVTNDSEDGDMKFSTMKGGALRDRLNINTGATVFNEDQVSVDFRVESDNFTHALFVDASANRVGIGTNTAPDHVLDVSFSDTTAVNAANLDNNTVSGISVNVTGNDTNAGPVLKFTSKAKDLVTGIAHQQMGTGTADFLIFSCFSSAPVERVRVEAGGDLKVNAGNLVIGTEGKGISFAATSDGTVMDNELFDDYEEGQYTVAMTVATNTIAIDASHDQLMYTKIGRVVTITGMIRLGTVHASAAGATSINLPFTSRNSDESAGTTYGTGWISLSGSAITNGSFVVQFTVEENTALARLFFQDAGTSTFENLGDNHSAAGDNLFVNFQYISV